MTAAIVDLSAYRQAKTAVNPAQAPLADNSDDVDADDAGRVRYIQAATQFLLGLPPTASASAPCLLFMDARGQLSVHDPMEETDEFPAGLTLVAALAPLGCEFKLASRADSEWMAKANQRICRLAARIRDAETRRVAL